MSDDYPDRSDTEYREARAWSGDDNRDSLTQEDDEYCRHCGARDDEACEFDCDCSYCIRKRARLAAQQAHEKEIA